MFNVPELRQRIAVAFAVDRKHGSIANIEAIDHDVDVAMRVVEEWLIASRIGEPNER